LPFQKKWTCPTFSILTTSALKPPLSAQNFEAEEAAATTELSSITTGT